MKSYRRLLHGEGEAMPAHRPYYPPLPAYYRDVEFQLVYFRTDPVVVREHLPEPLEADSEGLAVAFSIRVPFCSAYGPFNEAGLSVRCVFEGKPAFFNSHLYLDNVAAICSGRERWGAPKEYAVVRIERQGNLLACETVKDGVPIMRLTTSYQDPAEPDEMIPLFPSLRLKLIPSAEGPHPEIKQIVTATPQDMRISHTWKGNGMLTFGSSANSDLAGFAPREVLDAYFQVASYTETYGEILYDYLAGG